MTLAYGIISVIALVLLGLCIAIDRGKEIWLLCIFISVFVCCSGWLMLSFSSTLESALISSKITYVGTVFLPLFMIMLIIDSYQLKCNMIYKGILFSISLIMMILVITPGYLQIFIQSYQLNIINEAVTIEINEGPLHNLYYVYLIAYFLIMVGIIIYSSIKRKINKTSGFIILLIVIKSLFIWIIKYYLQLSFELLSISYIMSETILLLLYGIHLHYNMKQRIICIWTMVFFCIGISMLCQIIIQLYDLPIYYNIICNITYIIMYYIWHRSICMGIIQKKQRRCVEAIFMLLIMWMLINSCKYILIHQNITNLRMLWYSYSIPQVFIVTFSLIMTMFVGKGDDIKLNKLIYALISFAFLLLIVIFTNEYHQLIFTISPGVRFNDSQITYQFGYYVIIALMLIGTLISITILLVKCRIPKRRKYVGLPLLCLGFLLTIFFLYFLEGSFVHIYFYDMSYITCLVVASMLELLLQRGLITTNVGYGNQIVHSILALQISDMNFNIHYASATARKVSKHLLEIASNKPIMIDKTTRLSGTKIKGGYIYWQEDVSKLLEVQEQLEITQSELKDTEDVLKYISKQKEKYLQLVEQNKLYDLIEQQTSKQIRILNKLVQDIKQSDNIEEIHRLLTKIAIIGSYIKRKSNMILLAQQSSKLSVDELQLSINESMLNLQILSILTSLNIKGNLPLQAKNIYLIYDLFEAVIEICIDDLEAILVNVEINEIQIYFNMVVETKQSLLELINRYPTLIIKEDDDGLWYVNITLINGGDK